MRAVQGGQVRRVSERRAEQVLLEWEIFRHGRPEDLRALAAIAGRRRCRPNELILPLEESEHTVFVVESGWVGVGLSAPSGHEWCICYRMPRQAFRLRKESFEGGVATQAVAMEESAELLALPADRVTEIARRSPDLAKDVMMAFMEWIDVRDEASAETAFYTVKGRLSRELLKRAKDDPQGVARGARDELALAIATSRPATSRALNELRDDGVVDFDFTDPEHRIVILDRKRLAAQE